MFCLVIEVICSVIEGRNRTVIEGILFGYQCNFTSLDNQAKCSVIEVNSNYLIYLDN